MSSNVPVTVERYGRIIKQHIHDTDEIGYYHDVNYGCSVMVQQGKIKNQEQRLEFFGTIHVGAKSYLIQPPDDIVDSHSLTEIRRVKFTKGAREYVHSRPRTETNYIDPKDTTKKTWARPKRATKVYEIEILMVVDFSAYSFWRNRISGSASALLDATAKKNLRQYYALLLHSADLYYKSVSGRGYGIKLLFAGLHVSDRVSTSPWTEPLKNTSGMPVSVNSLKALERFKNWVNVNGNHLPGFDHAMLFTHYELHYYKLKPPTILGQAFLGQLCRNERVSIIQEILDVNTPETAAHELGHNLGAKHDGEDNSCLDSDGFIMAAPAPFYVNNSVNLNFWKFSSCSLAYFDAFIKNLTSKHDNCMATRSASYNTSALSEYRNELPGQVYPPDEQCHFLYGEDSNFCRAFYDNDYTGICDKMYCAANSTSCWHDIPFDGTVCGNGKMCREGKCITSTDAPTGLLDSCPHGDKPGVNPYLNAPCKDIRLKTSLHNKCYDRYYSIRCCESCDVVSKLYKGIANCEFGDRHSACDAAKCSTYDDNSREHICCSACSTLTTTKVIPVIVG